MIQYLRHCRSSISTKHSRLVIAVMLPGEGRRRRALPPEAFVYLARSSSHGDIDNYLYHSLCYALVCSFMAHTLQLEM